MWKLGAAVGSKPDDLHRPTQAEEQSMAVSREQVERIRTKLVEAPEAPAASVNTTKQEAVRSLVREIQGYQQRGYTLEQVGELFRGEGVLLTTSTLKNYLARAKAPPKRRAGKGAQAGGGAKAPVPAAVTPGASPPEAGRGEKSEVPASMQPTPMARLPQAVEGSEGGRREGASPEAPDGNKFRSGKDAFPGKDKASY
jgi:hypothetical protein